MRLPPGCSTLPLMAQDHIYSRSPLGTERSVAALTMDDLKRFHARNLVPGSASFRIVGALDQATVRAALGDLGSKWQGRAAPLPDLAPAKAPAKSTVYFYDIPGAKQSVFAFGHPAVSAVERRILPAGGEQLYPRRRRLRFAADPATCARARATPTASARHSTAGSMTAPSY